MSRSTLYIAAAAVALPLWILQRLLVVRSRLDKLSQDLPTDVVLFDPKLPFPLPDIAWVSRSRGWGFRERFSRFANYQSDVIRQVSIFPLLDVTYRLADATAVKEVFGRRAAFKAPPEQLGMMQSFGDPNIVASDDLVHKRIRKAILPAFNERNNELVWTESMRIFETLLETEEWEGGKIVTVKNVHDLVGELTLHIIASCGFGRKLSWSKADDVIPAGHKMRFQDVVANIAHNVVIKLAVPRFLAGLNKSWKDTHLAFDEVRMYVKEMIAERREVGEERRDLLSLLLDSGDKEADHERLPPEEIINNCVILLIGGHETSSSVFSFLLGELACDPNLQQKLYEHVKSFIGEDGSMPSYRQISKMDYALAVITETLRMYPIPNNYAKKCIVDTVVHTDEPGRTLLVPAGTMMEINHIGLHHNPRYWPEPNEFRPERFLTEYNRDAFVGFGGGTRSCPGRRFAEVEMTAFIVAILSRYRIEVPKTPEFRNITDKDALRAKLLEHKISIGLVPKCVPLVFVPRT